MYAIGLMSGTSLDGIDAALCKIDGYGIETNIELIAFDTYPIPSTICKEIKKACLVQQSNVEQICSLNFKLGKLFSQAVGAICEKAGVACSQIEFVASHGQTIYHIPKTKGNLQASTLQIGEPSIIAFDHNVKVLSDFRVMDMAAGGEGAPLVPYSEFILYSDKEKSRALQNIGGIGNVTILAKSGTLEEVVAFDTGPGNMMIDEACQRLLQKKYDEGGEVASQGKIHQGLLEDCLAHPFFTQKPPKSTGREDFGEQYVTSILKNYVDVSAYDVIATFTMFTAKSIAKSYRDYILPTQEIDELIVGGGGARNATLLRFLEAELPEIKVLKQEDFGYSSDAKEAIAFIILGNETLHHRPSNVPSATGAIRSVVLGKLIDKAYE